MKKTLALISILLSSGICHATSTLVLSTISLSPIDCASTNTATVTLFPSGGQAPYTYEMTGNPDHDSTSNVFENITPAGAYQFTVRDSSEQSIQTFITVGPTAFTNVDTQVFFPCSVESNGSIAAQAMNGVPPITATLTKPDGGDENLTNDTGIFNFENLAAGDYTLAIDDSTLDCGGISISISLPNSAPIEITALTTTPQMSTMGGSITVETTGGTGLLLYTLDDGPEQASNEFTNLDAGSYKVTVGISRGADITCTTSDTATVEFAPGNSLFKFYQKKFCTTSG